MNFLTRSTILFVATVVFVTTTCFAADVHYCENEIQSVALFHKAEPCGKMEKKVERMSKCCLARKFKLEKELQGKTIFKKQKCCSNKSVGFKADSEQHSTTEITTAPVVDLVADFNFEVVHKTLDLATHQVSHRGPPDHFIPFDFQVFYQVFRI